ncbi:hypothetical protein NGRA_0868 [Nosema granulosis]|uniref:Uncharacterized protein n=1 Tax=Nosema granulosis TaxID=83296 RepID=A0A9P6GZK6_9MICR|nr:hypothetical protein NGRA_0868 [Nosema granulosis]
MFSIFYMCFNFSYCTQFDEHCGLCDLNRYVNSDEFNSRIIETTKNYIKDDFPDELKNDLVNYLVVLVDDNCIVLNDNGKVKEKTNKQSKSKNCVKKTKEMLWKSIEKRISKGNYTIYLHLGKKEIESYVQEKIKKSKQNIKMMMINKNNIDFTSKLDLFTIYYDCISKKINFINTIKIFVDLVHNDILPNQNITDPLDIKGLSQVLASKITVKSFFKHVLYREKQLVNSTKCLYKIFCILIKKPEFKIQIEEIFKNLEQEKRKLDEHDEENMFISDVLSIIERHDFYDITRVGEKINCMKYVFITLMNHDELMILKESSQFNHCVADYYENNLKCMLLKIRMVVKLYKIKNNAAYIQELKDIKKWIPKDYNLEI